MKTKTVMTRFSLALCTLMALPLAGISQQNTGTANDRDGVILFVESKPEMQYRHMGTVECATVSPDKIDPLIDHMIKQARKKGEEFDGLIFRAGHNVCKADIIQYYKDPKARKSRGRRGEPAPIDPAKKKSLANDRDGKYIFIENSPTAENQLLGKIETSPRFKGRKPEEFIVEMLRIASETYGEFDAVVFIDGEDLKKANVIKFK